MAMRVREEQEGDAGAVRDVHLRAFPAGAEAELVDKVRGDADALVSLVAEEEGNPPVHTGGVGPRGAGIRDRSESIATSPRIIGHILVTRVHVDGVDDPSIIFGAIGPVGVLPERQGRGIGAALNRAAIEACRAQGMGAVFVLGDPAYYARFGFARADALGLRCSWEGTEDAFRVVVFEEGALRNTGTIRLVRYHRAFDAFA